MPGLSSSWFSPIQGLIIVYGTCSLKKLIFVFVVHLPHIHTRQITYIENSHIKLFKQDNIECLTEILQEKSLLAPAFKPTTFWLAVSCSSVTFIVGILLCSDRLCFPYWLPLPLAANVTSLRYQAHLGTCSLRPKVSQFEFTFVSLYHFVGT